MSSQWNQWVGFRPGEDAPPGLNYRVSLDGEEFGPWESFASLVERSPRAADAMAYVAEAGEDSDEGALQLIEAVADDLSLGFRETLERLEAEDGSIVESMIIDMAVDGAPILTIHAGIEWSETDADGDRQPQASPRSWTCTPRFIEEAVKCVRAERVHVSVIDFDRIPF